MNHELEARGEQISQELKEASEALCIANRRYFIAIEARIAWQKAVREWNGQEQAQ